MQSTATSLVFAHYYSVPDSVAEYCDERVCLPVWVCLFAIISSELHGRSSTIFLCMLPKAVARSSSDGIVICYVLPVLWTQTRLIFHMPKIQGRCDLVSICVVEHSNSGKKVSIRFSLPNRFFFDSIRQSDKFAACTLIFKQ